MRRFLKDYPRIQVKLHSSNTRELLDQFDKGLHDVLLTTEKEPSKGGEVQCTQRLVWTGAVGGNAWKKTPLPLGFSKSCAFRRDAIATLNEAGIDWEETVTAEDDSAGSAMVAMDLSIKAELEFADHTGREIVRHGGQLPDLPDYSIVLYHANDGVNRGMADIFSGYIARAFA